MVATPRIRQASSVAATAIPTTTETVLATSPPLSSDGASQQVNLQAVAGFTAGTGTTSVTVRIRRGSGITGTVVASQAGVQVTAGNTVAIPVGGQDNPGEVADQVYSVTVQQAAASANGANVLSSISAEIGS